MNGDTSQLPRSRAAMAALERALLRLQTAAARQNRKSEDTLFLTEQLRIAREEYDRLDQASRLVEVRLDGAAGRIKSILEG